MTDKKVFSYIGWVFFAMMVFTQILQIVITSVIAIISPQILTKPWATLMLVVTSFYLTTFPIYLFMMNKLPDYNAQEQKDLSLKQFIVLFIISIAATYIFNFASIIINLLLSFIKGGNIDNPLDDVLKNSSILYNFLLAVVIAPIIEEIIFRGVLINKLRCYGDRVCILVSAFMFALYHGNISQLLYAFVLGAIFSYIVLRCGTIKYSILLHMCINFCGGILFPTIIDTNSELLILIAVLAIFLSLIIGIILFLKNKKNIRLYDGEIDINKGIIFKNFGMIAYIILALIMIIIVVLS